MIGIYTAISRDESQQLADGQLLPDDMELYERENQLDIDKAWQALGYVLTGKLGGGEGPISYAVPMHGERLLDYGDYGAFYLLPEQVAEASAALAQVTKDDFQERFALNNPVKEQVYPVMDDEDEDEFLSYIYDYFTQLTAYYRQAAENRQGILFYIA
ncbi:YfbM family protein [Paenibacillus daejeonensis]|uniref:YfbM family protein n=1 Tax=Paenibacillus daejeonensis TaxID=135193 RepID=UPI001FE1C407|nr:YfbM family protein [Paenibacillus daejeonensis]